MKVSEKLALKKNGEISFSLEFFCPKTEQGVLNLIDRIDRMAKCGPLFVDITWNAGGSSSAETTLELVEVSQRELGLSTCMHMTCVDMPEEDVNKALKSAYDSGCRNILALRGDPPKERAPCPDAHGGAKQEVSPFRHAKDLIRHIRSIYGDQMSIGIAGYPEGHPEEPDPKVLIKYLKEKADAGADFIVTQMFYDAELFVNWCHEVRRAGITIPIIPGIMPVSGWSSFLRRARWCQINLPQKWIAELEPLSHDDAAVRERGTKLVAELCETIMDQTDVNHLHFYTMNLEKSLVMCLEALGLVKENDFDEEAVVELAVIQTKGNSRLRRGSSLNKVKPVYWRNRPASYVSRMTDEFPNGRWGDSRSPAFNGLNELEALLKVSSAAARKQWGHPTSAKDIGSAVIQYITGELKSLPWSESPAADEVSIIGQELAKLNNGSNEWFTINSQPAVVGVKSEDTVLGWGPVGGYVFQKAYVELMVHPKLWRDKLLPKLKSVEHHKLTYYAVESKKQVIISNAEEDEVNAITWGIFPGKEVVQPTIVEGTSFLAWKDEAFRIALEWARCYSQDSESFKFLSEISKSWVLVNMVHHDFYDPKALFAFLDL